MYVTFDAVLCRKNKHYILYEIYNNHPYIKVFTDPSFYLALQIHPLFPFICSFYLLVQKENGFSKSFFLYRRICA